AAPAKTSEAYTRKGDNTFRYLFKTIQCTEKKRRVQIVQLCRADTRRRQLKIEPFTRGQGEIRYGDGGRPAGKRTSIRIGFALLPGQRCICLDRGRAPGRVEVPYRRQITHGRDHQPECREPTCDHAGTLSGAKPAEDDEQRGQPGD